MLSVEALREYGANVDEGLGRCMGNKDLYLRLVSTVKNKKSFGFLKDSLELNY